MVRQVRRLFAHVGGANQVEYLGQALHHQRIQGEGEGHRGLVKGGQGVQGAGESRGLAGGREGVQQGAGGERRGPAGGRETRQQCLLCLECGGWWLLADKLHLVGSRSCCG